MVYARLARDTELTRRPLALRPAILSSTIPPQEIADGSSPSVPSFSRLIHPVTGWSSTTSLSSYHTTITPARDKRAGRSQKVSSSLSQLSKLSLRESSPTFSRLVPTLRSKPEGLLPTAARNKPKRCIKGQRSVAHTATTRNSLLATGIYHH